MTENQKDKFEHWMNHVDELLEAKLDAISGDLPDTEYWEAWADGQTPEEFVEDFVRALLAGEL